MFEPEITNKRYLEIDDRQETGRIIIVEASPIRDVTCSYLTDDTSSLAGAIKRYLFVPQSSARLFVFGHPCSHLDKKYKSF